MTTTVDYKECKIVLTCSTFPDGESGVALVGIYRDGTRLNNDDLIYPTDAEAHKAACMWIDGYLDNGTHA
jgi:hypothetical protein